MTRKHIITLGLWAIAMLCGSALFWASNKVQVTEQNIKNQSAEIDKHIERIRILEAEWHYLNNPSYLEKLALATFEGGEAVATPAPVILASGHGLPEIEVIAMPVRKPALNAPVQEQPVILASAVSATKESLPESAPIIVAEAETGHPEKSVKLVAAKAENSELQAQATPKDNQFSLVLASWAQ